MNFDKFESLGNSKTEEIENLESKIKEGIDYVFEKNPELLSLGTKEQYSEYLDTIFPESKVKDIVYHGSLVNIIGEFKVNQHFGSLDAAKSRNSFKKQAIGDTTRNEYYYPSLLNIKNVKRTDDLDYAWDNEINKNKNEGFDGIVYLNNNEDLNKDSYIVFSPKQIHILGSQSDIEKFKDFVSKNK